MLKMIGVTALTTLLPKLFDKIGDSLSDVYDSVFGATEKTVTTQPRKKRDTHVITQQKARFIREYREHNPDTGKGHALFFNFHFGWDKSVSAYARVWAPTFDITQLPEERDE